MTLSVIWEPDAIVLDGQRYTCTAELGRGKSAVSYRYTHADHSITVKHFMDTPDSHVPLERAVDFEVTSYQRMCAAGVHVPRLLAVNEEQRLLVKEYIAGKPLIEWVLSSTMTDALFEKVFRYHFHLKQAGFHVDYFPTNFLLMDDGTLSCVDYEAHPYNSDWDFPNWGLFYWLNAAGMQRFLQSRDQTAINQPGTYRPYEAPFLDDANRLRSLFADYC